MMASAVGRAQLNYEHQVNVTFRVLTILTSLQDLKRSMLYMVRMRRLRLPLRWVKLLNLKVLKVSSAQKRG